MSHIVLATLMRPDGGTGVQTHTRTVLDHVSSAGRRVTLATPFDAHSPLRDPAFALRSPLRLVSRPAAVWWYRTGHAHYLRTALRRHLTEDAVIYAQCPVSASAALETGRPVVMAVHFNGSQADEWAGKGEIPIGGRVYRRIRELERHVLPRLDGLVYVSEDSRRRVEEWIPDAARVASVVIANAVSPQQVDTRSSLIGDLITIGSLEPRKNQAYLLDVLAAARRAGRRCTLTVVGDGPDRTMLERRATRLGIAEDVRFLGYRADARALLSGHRLYAHTAVEESFGIVLVEAMSAGLPVLAAPVGGIPEVVRPGTDGLFWRLDDPRAAAETLVSLLDDSTALTAMSRAALRRAADFRPERQGQMLLAFLDDVERRARSAAPLR